MTAQPGLCRTWSEFLKVDFLCCHEKSILGHTPLSKNNVFVNYHVLKHQLTNLILSSFYIPKVVRPKLKLNLFPLSRPTLKKRPYPKKIISIFSQELFFFLISLQIGPRIKYSLFGIADRLTCFAATQLFFFQNLRFFFTISFYGQIVNIKKRKNAERLTHQVKPWLGNATQTFF